MYDNNNSEFIYLILSHEIVIYMLMFINYLKTIDKASDVVFISFTAIVFISLAEM